MRKRRSFSAEFKDRVALEALIGADTMACYPQGNIKGLCSACENLDNCHGVC